VVGLELARRRVPVVRANYQRPAISNQVGDAHHGALGRCVVPTGEVRVRTAAASSSFIITAR